MTYKLKIESFINNIIRNIIKYGLCLQCHIVLIDTVEHG